VLVGATAVTADHSGTVDLGNRHGTVDVRATVEK
jgi:hypothetical protein